LPDIQTKPALIYSDIPLRDSIETFRDAREQNPDSTKQIREPRKCFRDARKCFREPRERFREPRKTFRGIKKSFSRINLPYFVLAAVPPDVRKGSAFPLSFPEGLRGCASVSDEV